MYTHYSELEHSKVLLYLKTGLRHTVYYFKYILIDHLYKLVYCKTKPYYCERTLNLHMTTKFNSISCGLTICLAMNLNGLVSIKFRTK